MGGVENFDFSSLNTEERLLVTEYLRRKELRKTARSFLAYIKKIWPWFVIEEVHCLIAEKLEALRDGTIDRLLINLAPRSGKSLTCSEALPSWWIGQFPTDKILHASYAMGLVERFGRRIRNIMLDPGYVEMFPAAKLSKDSKAAAQWATSSGGEYNAAGVGSGVAGKGFNLCIIDDPVSEQDMYSRTVMDNVYEWYGTGVYTRRQPERNAIVLMQTRWNIADLSGRLLADAATTETSDKWEVLKIQAVIDAEAAELLNSYSNHPMVENPRVYHAGDSFAPGRWPMHELSRTKNQLSRKSWAALYMQSPVEDDGGILLRSYWRKWKKDTEPPKCEYVVQSYDTAFEEGEQNDFSARTTWGVFKRETDKRYCAILLERMCQRLNFPDLRENAWQSYKDYKPDRIIIEKAASGHPLIQELRKKGVPIAAIPPKGSKLARAHAAAIPLEQGCVYYFESRWADEVIENCAAFPNAPFDDLMDSVAWALIWLRRTFWLEAPSDERDEEEVKRLEPFDGQPPPTDVQRSYAGRRSRMSIGGLR